MNAEFRNTRLFAIIWVAAMWCLILIICVFGAMMKLFPALVLASLLCSILLIMYYSPYRLATEKTDWTMGAYMLMLLLFLLFIAVYVLYTITQKCMYIEKMVE